MLVKNEAHHLRSSLPMVIQQRSELAFEIVVIDSGSTDGSRELVADFRQNHPPVRLHAIEPDRFHHARTRNLGASLAPGRYLVFLGGDAVPRDDNWLAGLTLPFREGTRGLAASYSRQVPREDADVNNLCRMGYNYGDVSRVKDRDEPRSPKEKYFFSSVSCCIDLQAIAPPLFDERFPVNEDWTFARRMIGEGRKIAYCADSVVVHSHNYGYWDMLRRSFDNGVVGSKLGILDGDDPLVREEARQYLRYGWARLRERGLRARLQFVSFFLLSGVGVQLGMHHRLLPERLCTALSKYRTV